MSQLTDRLERDLREIAAGAHPSPSAWESIVARLGDGAESEVALVLAPDPDRSKRPVWIAVAAAALVVIAGSIGVLPRLGDDHLIATADPDATLVDFPNLTTTFVSPRNGFSVKYFDRGEGTLTPAKNLWDPGNEQADDGVDVVETGYGAVFKGASRQTPNEVSIDEWVDDYLSPGGCAPRSQQAEITIDGQSGRISECPNEIEATVVAGGRLYLFTLLHDRSDARAVFDAFAATIGLTPETAVDIPNLTTTFVSPTNGFSVKYFDRGGLTPAKDLWDPGNEQADDAFDVWETGFGAVFKGASTEIPDGVSTGEWVQDYVSPSGCRAPHSLQGEITIDGQVGRISECPNEIEAYVIADGRLYLFTLSHTRSDARAFFDAFVATIDLRPEAAAAP